MRGAHLRAWLDGLQPQCQSAYRGGRGTEDEIGKLGLFYEKAYLEEKAVASVSLDFSKAFDSVNHDILGAVLSALGMGAQDWRLMQRTALALSKRWRLSGQWLGGSFSSGTGVAQGCSISVGAFNAYLLPLMKRLEEREGLIILNYADDLVLASADADALQAAVDEVAHFAKLAKLKLNANKCNYWLYGKDVDELPARLNVDGMWLFPQSSAEVLGASMPAAETPFEAHAGKDEARDGEVRRRLAKLQSLPTSWKQKARAAASAVLPCADYASWTRKISGNRCKGLRHNVALAVHGQLAAGPRAIEVLLGAFSPIHVTDPRWSGAWRHLLLWSRSLSRDPEAWVLLDAALRGRLKSQGPVARLAHYIKELELVVNWEDSTVHRGDLWASLRSGALRDPAEQHRWRELLRYANLQEMERRRGDMEGLDARLDRKALSKLQEGRGAKEAALLRTIQAGALLTRERQCRRRGIGVSRCHCDEAEATFEHICWDCPTTAHLWATLRRPATKVERCCALPLLGSSWAQQKALAEHALASWTHWQREDQRLRGDLEDEEPEEREDDSGQLADRHESLVQRPAEVEEELHHLRVPQQTVWQAYTTCPTLEIERFRRWVRCASCHFTCSIADTKRLLELHERCQLPQRTKGQGSFPCDLPAHLTFVPASAGSVLRFLCLGCGAHEHASQRATFIARHWGCSEVDAPELRLALAQPE